MPARISRDEAWSLLSEWVQSPNRCAAIAWPSRPRWSPLRERDGHDAELWGVTGLLHDADYERFPDMDDTERGHPRTIMAELERATRRRRWSTRSPRTPTSSACRAETELDRTLLAVDELCGFLVACAWVRPEGIHGLTPKSVKKKLKQPSFAAAVNRDDVRGRGRRSSARTSTSTWRSSSPRWRRGPTSSSCTGAPRAERRSALNAARVANVPRPSPSGPSRRRGRRCKISCTPVRPVFPAYRAFRLRRLFRPRPRLR